MNPIVFAESKFQRHSKSLFTDEKLPIFDDRMWPDALGKNSLVQYYSFDDKNVLERRNSYNPKLFI